MSNTRGIVLVTGGTGLVGNGVRLAMESLNEPNYQKFEFIYLSSSDLDLTNKSKTIQYFKDVKPKFVIHLAAKVGGLFANLADNHGFFFDNMSMNINVLEAAHQAGVKRLVCCLSTCIFPDQILYPINEKMLHMGPPHESNYGYSYAKRMLDVMCKAYNEKFGTEYIPFIPTNVYGPFDNFNLKDCHVIPALIHKAYLALERKEPLSVAGTGKPLRQFIYSNDLGKLILWTLFEYKETTPIILSVPEEQEISIAQAAQAIADSMDLKAGIKITNQGADGQLKKTASNEKLALLYPGFEFTPFHKAIRETCQWFKDNYSDARK